MNRAHTKHKEPLLTLTFEGSEVNPGRIEVEHLVKVLDSFQKSSWVAADKLLQDHLGKVSRKQKILAHGISSLEVIAFESGSFVVALGVAEGRGSSPIANIEAFGESAVKNVVHTLRTASVERDALSYPDESTIKVLSPFGKLTPLFEQGIERVRVQLHGEPNSNVFVNREMCNSIEALSYQGFRKMNTLKEHFARPLKDIQHELTADKLLRSPLVGMWKDRSEVVDSVEFARHIRERAQIRER